ncbi:hypothetical protein FCV43_11060 [Vibrio genomosp. F6]|uniref:hypothetical protein n=1 Tax=Vibrio TaxID=662 RepID=UPI0010BDB2FA|nr:hypothetical protein [Vibrio genomosp. F6]TKF21356.1 hypothetical protein FCV43_11060 [Vibrio genomosp. F6]
MKVLKAVLIVILFAAVSYVGWLFLPPQASLEKQTLDLDLNASFKLVGFRHNSGDPSLPLTYHYFITLEGEDVKDHTPFLITTDPFVKLKGSAENTLALVVNGKIDAYTNDVWVKQDDGILYHWYVSLDAKYVR